MKQPSLLLATALLTFGTAACQQKTADEQVAAATNDQINADTLAPDGNDLVAIDQDAGSPTPVANAADNAASHSTTPVPGAAVIPAQYRGRWGMVPGDCTSTRGDAKGLISIADKTIRFYESTATLKQQRPAIATSFGGVFDFTGEGQSWTKVETLTRTGAALKRADNEGSYTYTRCL